MVSVFRQKVVAGNMSGVPPRGELQVGGRSPADRTVVYKVQGLQCRQRVEMFKKGWRLGMEPQYVSIEMRMKEKNASGVLQSSHGAGEGGDGRIQKRGWP